MKKLRVSTKQNSASELFPSSSPKLQSSSLSKTLGEGKRLEGILLGLTDFLQRLFGSKSTHPQAHFSNRPQVLLQALILEPMYTPSGLVDGMDDPPEPIVVEVETLQRNGIDLPEIEQLDYDVADSPQLSIETADTDVVDFAIPPESADVIAQSTPQIRLLENQLEEVSFIDNQLQLTGETNDLIDEFTAEDLSREASELGSELFVRDFPDSSPTFDSGIFTVGETGEVSFDFLFDGGKYEGQLAIFSLEGMDKFEPGSQEFIAEAARHALSDSELGYVVIDDLSEGARFSGSVSWEGDLNAGDYLGVKTVNLRPGDQFGIMLIPNGTVEEVFDNPAVEGAKRPLFSMVTANPNDAFHVGQIADFTGDGNTFVMEDLRVDGKTDQDYNDIIFQIRGATGEAIQLDEVVDPNKDLRTTDLGQALIAYTEPYVTPTNPNDFSLAPESLTPTPPQVSLTEQPLTPVGLTPTPSQVPSANQPLIGIIDTGFSANNPDIDYSQITLGQDRVDGDANPLLQPGEGSEHGTHVLGIIGATQDNATGIDGINDDAPIWVSRAVDSGQWAESLVEFVDAAQESGQPNAVVNLSFDLTQINFDGSEITRYELTPAERAAIEYARQNNVLIIASAGNDGGLMSALGQASQEFDNIITVGAADGVDRASYSNYGFALDIMALGGTVEAPMVSTIGDGLGSMAGTSVAAAQVTGAASEVWAVNPDLNYRQVIEILKLTATDLKTPNWDVETGTGLLNLAAAVGIAKVIEPEHHTTPPINIPDIWSGEGRVTPWERAAGVFSQLPAEGAVTAIAGDELQRLNDIKSIIIDVANQFNIFPEIIAGIISRETNTRNIIGDGGRGHGYMQLDIGTFPNIQSEPWNNPAWNIQTGVNLLINDKFPYIRQFLPESLWLRGSIAAYNGGQGNVVAAYQNGLDVDAYTTGRNYSTDVLSRARWLQQNGWSGGSSLPEPTPSPLPDPGSTQIGRVNSLVGNQQLRLRNQPSTIGTQVLDLLPQGTELKIFRKVSSSDPNWSEWYEVEVNGKHGYVAAYYVDIISNNSPSDPEINWVEFSGTVGPNIGVNLRYSRRFAARSPYNEPKDKQLEFDAWAYGEVGTDLWLETPDARWFKIKDKDLWVPSAYIYGNPPNSQPLPPDGGDIPGGGDDSTLSIPVDWNLPEYTSSQNRFWPNYAPVSVAGNLNLPGNCTWYTHGRLKQLGYNSSVLNGMLGNAREWNEQAPAAGATISNIPQVGSIAQWEPWVGGTRAYGHVAVVEQVNPDGSIVISESNWASQLYSTRTLNPNTASWPSNFIIVPRQ